VESNLSFWFQGRLRLPPCLVLAVRIVVLIQCEMTVLCRIVPPLCVDSPDSPLCVTCPFLWRPALCSCCCVWSFFVPRRGKTQCARAHFLRFWCPGVTCVAGRVALSRRSLCCPSLLLWGWLVVGLSVFCVLLASFSFSCRHLVPQMRKYRQVGAARPRAHTDGGILRWTLFSALPFPNVRRCPTSQHYPPCGCFTFPPDPPCSVCLGGILPSSTPYRYLIPPPTPSKGSHIGRT